MKREENTGSASKLLATRASDQGNLYRPPIRIRRVANSSSASM